MEQKHDEAGHTCIKGGRPVVWKNRLIWADPGELTKVAGEERWGRVELLYNCCGARQVRFEAFGEDEAEVRMMRQEELENPWEAYPANLPPRGYPIPRPWPMKGSRPFPGSGARKEEARQ
jgi:hypothetical protein